MMHHSWLQAGILNAVIIGGYAWRTYRVRWPIRLQRIRSTFSFNDTVKRLEPPPIPQTDLFGHARDERAAV